MRLYVIGPVSGHEGDNREEFEEARRQLEEAGFKVAIPHDKIEQGTPWQSAMRASILLRAIGEEIPRSPQPWRRERGGLEFISWKMRPHHRREPVSGVQRRGQPQGIG